MDVESTNARVAIWSLLRFGIEVMEAMGRIELPYNSFADCRLTTWLHRHKQKAPSRFDSRRGFVFRSLCAQTYTITLLGSLRSKHRHNSVTAVLIAYSFLVRLKKDSNSS